MLSAAIIRSMERKRDWMRRRIGNEQFLQKRNELKDNITGSIDEDLINAMFDFAIKSSRLYKLRLLCVPPSRLFTAMVELAQEMQRRRPLRTIASIHSHVRLQSNVAKPFAGIKPTRIRILWTISPSKLDRFYAVYMCG